MYLLARSLVCSFANRSLSVLWCYFQHHSACDWVRFTSITHVLHNFLFVLLVEHTCKWPSSAPHSTSSEHHAHSHTHTRTPPHNILASLTDLASTNQFRFIFIGKKPRPSLAIHSREKTVENAFAMLLWRILNLFELKGNNKLTRRFWSQSIATLPHFRNCFMASPARSWDESFNVVFWL